MHSQNQTDSKQEWEDAHIIAHIHYVHRNRMLLCFFMVHCAKIM
jgi:hypothetical protein